MKKITMIIVAGCLFVCMGAVAIAEEEEVAFCDETSQCCQAALQVMSTCIEQQMNNLGITCEYIALQSYDQFVYYCIDFANYIVFEQYELCMLNPSACANAYNDCMSGWWYQKQYLVSQCMVDLANDIPNYCFYVGNDALNECNGGQQ